MSDRNQRFPISPRGPAKRRVSARHREKFVVPVRAEVQELCRALEKMRAGRLAELDAARLLEIAQTLGDVREDYWATLALAIADQAASPVD